ncbi:uncharacterized protein EDB91DRAFT_1265716 [Suillus paluster]|uniref:uncharacterized protein n=1 Tax=Suillus paluster TaxID=48578 RepID=UPI001B88719A|nr:uncharacterized protein EDB91DRAFT_1265716 [Suillus paluster]KAG1725568.1 hypothetical protein EDB91DRAFT_1265716 [Suillus paluster]
MSDTQSMLIDGISAQPSVPPATSASWTDIIPADKQDPYQLPIGLDLSFFDNIEAHTTTDTCVFTGESFSEHDAIFEFACEDYCSTFFSSSEQRSDAPGVKNPDNRCAISPRVGLGETGNDKEVSSQQPVGSPVLFSNHEVIVEFASEGYCSSFSEQQSDAPGGVKELDSQITILPRVVLGEIRESNNDGPVVFTRDASSCAGVPSFEEVSPKEPLRSRPSPRVSVDRQLANNSFSFKLILESLAHNPESLSYMVEPFPPPCSNVPANECLAVDGASTSGTIIFTANDSVFSALCALPVVDADSDTSCADLTLVIEGSKSPVAAPAKTMCPLSESIPDNIKVIHDALLEADVTLVGQDNAQGDDVPEVHTNDQAAEMYNIESAYTAYFLSTPWPAPGRTRCKDGGWTTSHCIVLGEDGPGPGDYEEADAFIRDAISWATDSFCPTTLPVPVCISQPPSPESSPDSLEPVTGQMIPEKFVDADYEREIESQVEDTLAAIMLLLDVGDGDN